MIDQDPSKKAGRSADSGSLSLEELEERLMKKILDCVSPSEDDPGKDTSKGTDVRGK